MNVFITFLVLLNLMIVVWSGATGSILVTIVFGLIVGPALLLKRKRPKQ